MLAVKKLRSKMLSISPKTKVELKLSHKNLWEFLFVILKWDSLSQQAVNLATTEFERSKRSCAHSLSAQTAEVRARTLMGKFFGHLRSCQIVKNFRCSQFHEISSSCPIYRLLTSLQTGSEVMEIGEITHLILSFTADAITSQYVRWKLIWLGILCKHG